jgi:hypothetical protein
LKNEREPEEEKEEEVVEEEKKKQKPEEPRGRSNRTRAGRRDKSTRTYRQGQSRIKETSEDVEESGWAEEEDARSCHRGRGENVEEDYR